MTAQAVRSQVGPTHDALSGIILEAATMSSALVVLAIVVPVCGALAGFAASGRYAERIALVIMPFGLAIAVALMVAVPRADALLAYELGGWAPPLGITLRADGLSAAHTASRRIQKA
jgi:multicomponent Na+:H+ antiporter subunit D